MTRALLRGLAHRAGVLALRHRLRNRNTLTVAMFHRVVEPGSAAARHADPVYTLPADLFAGVLAWVARHYAVVGLAQVLAAQSGGSALPPCALLLSFDDGWQDNAAVALPLLRRAGLPAVLFLTSDALADAAPFWWQEVLLRAVREGVPYAALWDAAGGGAPPVTADPLALLLRYAALDDAARARSMAGLTGRYDPAEGRHMLHPAQVAGLAAAGIAVGAHGAAHGPLPQMADPAGDLARCRAALGVWVPHAPVTALSFPHGQYTAGTIALARAAGFASLFTSDACLNAAPGGRPGALLGRISVQASGIAGTDGFLDPARLATWLMHRPIRRL